jgi:UDP-glucose 4-epimerase
VSADPAAAYRDAEVLVTGGLGFIGSHLSIALVGAGARVAIADALVPGCGGNPYNVRSAAGRLAVSTSDLRDQAAMGRLVRGKDVIFNLAGRVGHVDSMSDPLADLDINCRAHVVLLEACRAVNPAVRIVVAASRQQYGRPLQLPVREEHPLAAVDVNGINLIAREAYHLLYHEAFGIRACSLRLTNTYGPHLAMDGGGGFLADFIRRAVEGRPIEVFGDGAQVRDVAFVTDVVDAFLRAGATDEAFGRALNVGGAAPISVLEVARLCHELGGRDGEVRLVPWPDERRGIEIGSVHVDDSRLRALTGWAPRVEPREGLRQTIDFYRRHGRHYWPQPGAGDPAAGGRTQAA